MNQLPHPSFTPWLFALLVLVAAAALATQGLRDSVAPPDLTPTSSDANDASAIRLEVELTTTEFTHGDRVLVPVFAINTGRETYQTTFPTTCTDPTLLLDGQPLLARAICGQALTTVSLAPGERRYLPLQFKLIDPAADTNGLDDAYGVRLGRHELLIGWGEVIAEPVTIYVK